MAALICGSLAFDTLMGFEGRFAQQILPDRLHQLNVAFQVPTLRREFGGCAGNIAYSLKLLGGTPLPVATLGSDGAGYLQRLHTLGIATRFVQQTDHAFTAQAMVITDRDNHQITAFHPGAMVHAQPLDLGMDHGIALASLSPDTHASMLRNARLFAAAGIPFVFDPGQALPMFTGAELDDLLSLARWVVANDYEACMLSERTGLGRAALSRRVDGLVVTLGAEGSEVWEQGCKAAIPPVQATALCDPTGCGDAFRGALLYGLEAGWSLQRCAVLGNHMGARKIASQGAQNYTVDLELLVSS
ncbi:MAG: carbohydrate kinase family protein [Pseudomonadota bacterium]